MLCFLLIRLVLLFCLLCLFSFKSGEMTQREDCVSVTSRHHSSYRSSFFLPFIYFCFSHILCGLVFCVFTCIDLQGTCQETSGGDKQPGVRVPVVGERPCCYVLSLLVHDAWSLLIEQADGFALRRASGPKDSMCRSCLPGTAEAYVRECLCDGTSSGGGGHVGAEM